MVSKSKDALPHLERCTHHFTLAAKAFAQYVAALGGHVLKGATEEEDEQASSAPPRRPTTPRPAKLKAAAPAGPTSPPEMQPGREPDLWGKAS